MRRLPQIPVLGGTRHTLPSAPTLPGAGHVRSVPTCYCQLPFELACISFLPSSNRLAPAINQSINGFPNFASGPHSPYLNFGLGPTRDLAHFLDRELVSIQKK